MPRANRYFLPGHVWHITHRCHKKEFLLKFNKDRENWKNWLFEAKKRYKIKILNYIVTSNHIHLLIFHEKGKSHIPDTMQLVAGRTAQLYNKRKNRKGAFWEDRYHATAISQDNHLLQCMIYIDMNMVRAGIVSHPCEWKQSGFNEIISDKKRYTLIDLKSLTNLLNFQDTKSFRDYYKELISETIEKNKLKRVSVWSESIAVGNNDFVYQFKEELGVKSKPKKIKTENNLSYIKEEQTDFKTDLLKGHTC